MAKIIEPKYTIIDDHIVRQYPLKSKADVYKALLNMDTRKRFPPNSLLDINQQHKYYLKMENEERVQLLRLIHSEFKKSYPKSKIKFNKKRGIEFLKILMMYDCPVSFLIKLYESTHSLDNKSDSKLAYQFVLFLQEFNKRSQSENEKLLQDQLDYFQEEIRKMKKKESLYREVYEEIDKRLEENYPNYGKSKTQFIKHIIEELIDSKKYPDLNTYFKNHNSNYNQTKEHIRLCYVNSKK